MPYLYTTPIGRRLASKTLTVETYMARQDRGLLTASSKILGFKVFVPEEPKSPFLIDSDRYLAKFRAQWIPAIEEAARSFGVSFAEAHRLITEATLVDAGITTTFTTITADTTSNTKSTTSNKTIAMTKMDDVITNQEHTTTEVSTTATKEGSATNDNSTSRVERKNAVLKKLRAPPLTHEWEFYHERLDRHKNSSSLSSSSSPSSSSSSSSFGNGFIISFLVFLLVFSICRRLTNQLNYHDRHVPVKSDNNENLHEADKADKVDYVDSLVSLMEINNVQTFWETFNNFPLESLRIRDSIHLFKRTVKPVWEDKRNANGGSWTFRVAKEKSAEFWMAINLMAIGEGLQDSVEPGKSLFSHPFHHHPLLIFFLQ